MNSDSKPSAEPQTVTTQAAGKKEQAPPSKPPPLPPPPVVHSTTERLPVLASAPPSASASFTTNNATAVMSPTLVDLPPPPRMTGISVPPPPAPTVVQMPPPPPPVRQEPIIRRETPVASPIGSSVGEDDEEQPPSSPESSGKLLEEPPRVHFFPPEHSLLARRQSHIPILVIATEAAHRMAWKNKLRLVDLLGGLAQDLSSVAMPLPPFRSVARSMVLHWDTLKVSFVEPSDFQECTDVSFLQHHARISETDDSLEDQVDHMLQHSQESTQDGGDDIMEEQSQRQSRLKEVSKDAFALTSPPDTPWLVRYRTALDETTDCLEHDLIQAPPLCLLVCTTNDFSSPVDCLRELSSPHFLPPPFHNGTYDRQSLRAEALVLHDNVDGGQVDEASLKQTLVHQFGGGAAILRINSVLPETAAHLAEEEEDDLWNGGGSRGCCLSVNDRLVLRRYIATLITASLLPALERRISDLNFIVTDRKKGVKNVFKSLWRKPKEETPQKTKQLQYAMEESNKPSTVKYRHDTIESQVRMLADTLFLVRDWEAALGMYRLIKDDYKSDKAMLEHGSVNEMMALAAYMLDSFGRAQEAFSYMETALYSYTRAAEDERPSGPTSSRPSQASPATRLATRLCLVLASATQMTSEHPLEVADLLASASSHETPLGAAVLLEQSSLHYYRAGMYRKYAFHMLMSGHMFRSAMQEHHAFRCFTSALYIYHDGRWDELHNHLRSALAAQLYSLGRMSVSLELYAKLVGTRSGGRVSTKSQQKFVQHMMEICQQYSGKAMVGADRMASENRTERLERIEQVLHYTEGARRILELPNMDLPSVDDESVTVTVDSEEVQRDIRSLGTMGEGDPAVWQELKCHAEAELRAVEPSSSTFNLEDGSPTLANIEDPLIRRVVAAIDKDKTSMNLLAKAKRSGNHKETPAVRARMEPLSVKFVIKNPLSIQIDMKELQLVARMTESASHRVCTNEDAIAVGPYAENRKTWTFPSSTRVFEVPAFCRMSSINVNSGPWVSPAKEEPFFVVTKVESTLEPGSATRVSLAICPLVLGELEVVGVRCKLFNDVWVYHPFNIKGPLLQNSSENRANRVRAESMLLKATVDQDMPRLSVRLIPGTESGGDGPVLVGQVSPWTLRLSNIGTAPACNLSLKTNKPWCTVDAGEEAVESSSATAQKEGLPTPNSVGASGTLVKLPLEGGSLKTAGVLHPGESVDIPVHIRTAEGGRHSLYMLYRYELFDPSSTSSTKRRWLQNMISVPASPSMTLTASLMPSFWKQNEHVMSVEVTNYRTDGSTELDVELDKLCIISRHYRMELLEGQLATSSAEASPFNLGWQERVTLHYRVIPLNSPYAPCMLSECDFSNKGQVEVKECVPSGTTNYLCLERAQHEFLSVLKRHQVELARAAAAEEGGGHPRSVAQIRRANTSLSGVDSLSDRDGLQNDSFSDQSGPAHPTSIAKLCSPEGSKSTVNMVCTWSARGGGSRTDTVHGQHHFTKLLVRPTTSSRGCPITITCRHPTVISHNFEKGALNIPFEVTVRNRLVETTVDFEFSVERPKAFEIIGTECFEWCLKGGEELTVPMQAVVPKGGVYNLQNVRLTVTKADKKVPYLFPLQWIVRVDEQ